MIKVRANKISIERPKEDSEAWIRVDVQRIEKYGEIYNTVDRWDSFNKRMSDVYADQYPNPIDFSSGMFSVADIATHITIVVSSWLAEKYNGTIDPENGDIVIEK